MRRVYIASGADDRLKQFFEASGYEVEPVSTSGIVSGPVSDHPDMFMCRLGISDDAPLISYRGKGLSPGYPSEAAFNAACTGRYFIHNLNCTDSFLLAEARRLGMIFVDVKQGYAKCSTVVVDEDSVITYDRGIVRRCTAAGMNVLQVSPGHVVLKGYGCGFIGGASGRIGNTVFFNGDLPAHPDFRAIRDFIEERGISVKWFSDWPLTDIGTII
jgi:hypothetical protein